MNKFKNILLVFLGLFILSINAEAQKFDIYQIDTTEYPKIKAFYTIKDEFFQNYNGITKNDFKVQQNGKDVNFDLNCLLLANRPAISMALMLDASSSMLQKVSPTEERHQWALYGAKRFVDSLKFTAGSAFSLITFGGSIDKSTEWTGDSVQAKADLNKYNVGVNGATNLSKPFYETAKGSLDKLILRPKNSKRVAVMLTDGGHEAGQTFMRDEIIKKAKDNNIEIYIILLNAPGSIGSELELLTYETGGKLFRPNTKAELEKVFFDIYNSLQNNFTCRLEWIEPYICQNDNPNRDVTITFTRTNPGLVSTNSYLVPTKGISKFDISESKIYFSDLKDGQISKDITLKAITGNFKLTNFSITPNNGSFNIDWKGKSPLDLGGLVITQGNSKTITINYVEKNSLDESNYVLSFADENCELPNVELIAPCGGVTKDISFSNLPLLSQDLILKDVYLNNSDRIVNVNVKVLNDINNEITLKDGNIYQLNPNEYLSLDVTFNPANNSEKNINLEFSTENGCSKPIAKFNATIGSVNILANSYDFGKVRVKTPKDGFIKVENNSTFNITLNDIEINTNNYFIFDDIKTTPLTLAPNSSKNINIKYVSNVEKDIVEIVKLKGLIVEQSNEPITIETQIKVISYLPNLNTVNKITFPKTDLGVATNSIGLKIKNNSLFGDLKIQEIRFKNNKSNSDFSFVANPNLKNIDVLSNGELNLNLIFKPTKNGFQSDTLEIIADNVEGPDPVNFIKTEVILEGNTNTIDNLVFEDISFGNTFLCANPQKSVTIDNQSGSGKITFTVAKINNSSDFEIVLPNSLEVLNGQTSSFDIIYTPQNSGTHNETIEVSFSDGRKGTFGISGESTTIPFKSTFKNKNELLTPGNLANIGFVSNFDSENYGEISTIIYTLKFDPTFFRADKNPFTTDLGDTKWSWTVDISNQSEGVLIITGKSNDKSLEKPKKINNSLNLQTYLADKTETFITVDTKIDNNCVIAETDTTTIKYQGCLIDNRIITISDNTFYVKELTPNVMSTSQELNYGLGFDCEVDIKLYDIMGNLINDLGKETQKQGEHKVLLPIEQIPNGMYYIQLYAGPFVKNIKFIINK